MFLEKYDVDFVLNMFSSLGKAIKTDEEIKNERIAHIKDAIAVTKLLYYIKKVMPNSVEYTEGKVTELSLADKLDGFRKEQSDYLYQSFAPIIASGEHGAIIHYDPTPETDIPIQNNTFLLMDTGGQYYQGTTDITRTISVGEVDYEMKRNYTLVLRGHLALAMAVFKDGTCGQNLDVLARGPFMEQVMVLVTCLMFMKDLRILDLD